MKYLVNGTVVFFFPVAKVVDADNPIAAQEAFVEWAKNKTANLYYGEHFTPGVSQDESRPGEIVTVPYDGVTIDTLEAYFPGTDAPDAVATVPHTLVEPKKPVLLYPNEAQGTASQYFCLGRYIDGRLHFHVSDGDPVTSRTHATYYVAQVAATVQDQVNRSIRWGEDKWTLIGPFQFDAETRTYRPL